MLIIDLNTFALDSKYEILNEKDELQYWSQPDFAYKKRVHIYDNKDNELGYVQYKILSCQDGATFFNKEDKDIDLSDLKIINIKGDWQFDIEDVASINVEVKKIMIDIVDEHKIDKCLLFIYSLFGKEND